MPAPEHPEYSNEASNLEYTLGYLKQTLGKSILYKEEIDKKVDYGMKHFNADASQEYIDLIVNSQIQGYQAMKLVNLSKALEKPYFARIDFRETEYEQAERLYIGKVSLSREEDEKLLIIDWRAPIANLYYEGRLGDASYTSPDGVVEGTLSLKRQFTIAEGNLRGIFDIDITTSDELLQSCLGASADNRLKDIVSTIQEEQNKIVRADMWKPLIVQGAAGSGKTTIALHRIAYLVYTYEKSFDPESFMIIAPSKLFLNYISEVLPELGVDRVKQTTFKDFAMDILRKKFKMQDENEKLVRFSDSSRTEEERKKDEQLKACSKLKCSMAFKDLIDQYIGNLEKHYIPRKDFTIGGKVVYSHEQIFYLFTQEYARWPFALRMQELKKHLTSGVENAKKQLIAEIQQKAYEFLQKIKSSDKSIEEKQKLIQRLYDRQEEALRELEAKAKRSVKEYMEKIPKLHPFDYYQDFIKTLSQGSEDFIGSSTLRFLKDYTGMMLAKGYIELEDLAPMIYLKYRVYGMEEKIPVKHIILDEAQDFSAFQIYVLKMVIKDSSFTILGDLCQGIHSYRGVHSWEDIAQNVFGDKGCKILSLQKSYRTTVEIMGAANCVLEQLEDHTLPKGEPVIRHGEAVKLIKRDSAEDIAAGIAEIIRKERGEHLSSVAVICKTLEECMQMYSSLKKNIPDIHVITGKESEYKTGVVLLPSYLSKGLEFDIVIIANANSVHYRKEEMDIKLLYVSMTRPLHKLFIFYEGDCSPVLSSLNERKAYAFSQKV